jgi:hypothetical protein
LTSQPLRQLSIAVPIDIAPPSTISTEGKEFPDDWNDPANVTRPVREYLDQLDKAAGLALLTGEASNRRSRYSLTDPQAALTSKGRET